MEPDRLNTQRPKGRTVFEYSRAGGFPCRKEGYLLYFDGRVYTVSQTFGYTACVDDFHNEAEHYHLIATCKPLADEVKKFIRDNKARIDALPPEMPSDYGVCDGWKDSYKFLGKKASGYMIPPRGAGEVLRALHADIIVMFRRNGVELGEVCLS